RDGPARFEAGTPNVEGAIALGAAIDYIEQLGFAWIQKHEQQLIRHSLDGLRRIPGVQVYGRSDLDGKCCGPVAFTMRKLDSHVVARILSDRQNIMVRSGHHCAQPLHEALDLPATLRASYSVYNTSEEVDVMLDVLRDLQRFS